MKSLLPVICLLFAGCGKDPAGPAGSRAPGDGAGSVRRVELVEEPGSREHLHLVISAELENSTSSPLTVTLLAGEQEIPPFVAPGLEPPVIGAGVKSEVTTHWWMPRQELAKELSLSVGGKRLPVRLPAKQ